MREFPPDRLRLGLSLGLWERFTSWDQVIAVTRLAEALGYQCVVVAESFGHNGFVLCDRLLTATREMHVCLGIANVFSRSPAVLAASAATLDAFSGGRFILGLGGSTPNLVRGWHGLEFARPLQRTREAVEICRRIWRRDASPYEGDIFRPAGVKLTFAPVRERIPIWHGALLPRGLELCGGLADGWMPTLLPRDCVAAARPALHEAATRAGRQPDEVLIAPIFQALANAESPATLEALRFQIAAYYGPPNSPYARVASSLGYAEEVQSVIDAYASGGSRAAAEATSERLAASIALGGSPDACREQLRALHEQGADLVIVGMPGATAEQCEPVLRRMAEASRAVAIA